jgi:hypothetical protein
MPERLRYSRTIATLISDRLPVLGPGMPNDTVRRQLAGLTVDDAFDGAPIADESAARCCLVALWLWHDFLDESHAISQEIDTADGSYWHAIMHRRESDYFNAKYWFRRVPQHAIFEPLTVAARELASQHELDAAVEFLATQSNWEAFRFVDLCEAIARGKSRCEQLAREVARAEWQLLFDHCYRAALAGTKPGPGVS